MLHRFSYEDTGYCVSSGSSPSPLNLRTAEFLLRRLVLLNGAVLYPYTRSAAKASCTSLMLVFYFRETLKLHDTSYQVYHNYTYLVPPHNLLSSSFLLGGQLVYMVRRTRVGLRWSGLVLSHPGAPSYTAPVSRV